MQVFPSYCEVWLICSLYCNFKSEDNLKKIWNILFEFTVPILNELENDFQRSTCFVQVNIVSVSRPLNFEISKALSNSSFYIQVDPLSIAWCYYLVPALRNVPSCARLAIKVSRFIYKYLVQMPQYFIILTKLALGFIYTEKQLTYSLIK